MHTVDENRLIEMIKAESSPLRPRPTGEETRILRKGDVVTPRAVLFDIYGTLFISASGDISLAENQHRKNDRLEELVRHFEIDIPPDSLGSLFIDAVRKEHQRLKQQGIPYPEVRVPEIWSQILSLNPDREREKAREFALAYELAVNPVYPMPGVEQLLNGLSERGITMGIISNAQFFTPLLFNAFLNTSAVSAGFSEELSFFSYMYRRAKPDAFLYEKALDTLKDQGIRAEEALYIGNDMLNDIYPASVTGFQTALFAGDARSLRWRKDDPRCRDLQPGRVINSLVHLLDIV